MAEALFESECLGVEHAVNNEVFYGKSRGENPRDFGEEKIAKHFLIQFLNIK